MPEVQAPPDAPGQAAFARGGVIVIDKPAGPTSHDVVAAVRRHCGGAKVGHTGTLDPFATGVLPLVVGRATRLARFLGGSDKEYVTRIRLGVATDTHDITGHVVSQAPEAEALAAAGGAAALLPAFLGRGLQSPPAYSAKLSDGVRAYEQARRGRAVDLAPAEVTVFEIDMLEMEGPSVTVRLVTSAGFYVRAFARDIGERLGVGASLDALRRTRSGAFRLSEAVTLDAIQEPGLREHLIPIDALLPDCPAAVLTPEGVERIAHGRDIGPGHLRGTPEGAAGAPQHSAIRLLGPDGGLLALAELASGGVLHPAVVLM